MTLLDAMKAAREQGLDVVEISPNAVPPVCKLVDYGKFLYEQSKKAHEAKKHQKSSHIKEVKFRPSTAEHDYQVRKNQIIRFLGEHITQPAFTCRLRWEPDMVALWDNRLCVHQAYNDYQGHRRELYRTTVRGEKPA